MPSVFSQHLRRLRLQHGLTQAQLATALQLKHQSHIAHLETPRGDADWPALSLLTAIARYFAVSIDSLLFTPTDQQKRSPHSLPPWPYEQTAFRLLGAKIRVRRTEQRWTLVELSHRLQVNPAGTYYSRSFLSNVEAGRKLITVPTLARLVTIFDVSADYLLRDDLPLEPRIPYGAFINITTK